MYRQYDHQLFLNTVMGPGDDASVLKLRHPTTGVETGRALAITTDGNQQLRRQWIDIGHRTLQIHRVRRLPQLRFAKRLLMVCDRVTWEVTLWIGTDRTARRRPPYAKVI